MDIKSCTSFQLSQQRHFHLKGSLKLSPVSPTGQTSLQNNKYRAKGKKIPTPVPRIFRNWLSQNKREQEDLFHITCCNSMMMQHFTALFYIFWYPFKQTSYLLPPNCVLNCIKQYELIVLFVVLVCSFAPLVVFSIFFLQRVFP